MTTSEILYSLRLVPLCLALLGFICLWAWQFMRLMLLPDSDFPGRNDKLVWGLAFLIMFPIAPFLFSGWKTEEKEKRQEAIDSDS